MSLTYNCTFFYSLNKYHTALPFYNIEMHLCSLLITLFPLPWIPSPIWEFKIYCFWELSFLSVAESSISFFVFPHWFVISTVTRSSSLPIELCYLRGQAQICVFGILVHIRQWMGWRRLGKLKSWSKEERIAYINLLETIARFLLISLLESEWHCFAQVDKGTYQIFSGQRCHCL